MSAAIREKNRFPLNRFALLRRGVRRDWQLIALALPAVICIAIFCYAPMGGVLYAFQKVGLRTSIWQNKWVGLQWFEEFFGSIYCWRTIRNTLVLNFLMLLCGTVMEIFLAIIFNEIRGKNFKRLTQSCSYFPNFISTTVVVGMMVSMLDPNTGVLNLIYQKLFGAPGVDLFVQPGAFRPLYVLSSIWQGAGWGSIIYLGAINGIDPELYEAAALDGCGRVKRVWHITLPGMKPVIVICLILHIGSMMSLGADKILLMYSPATYETADVISTFVYRYGLGGNNYGYGTAVGLFNSFVNLALLLTANAISSKLSDTSLF